MHRAHVSMRKLAILIAARHVIKLIVALAIICVVLNTARLESLAQPNSQHQSIPRHPASVAVVSLPKLWSASKAQVIKAMRGRKLLNRDRIPKDDPDALRVGGEERGYSLGG